MTEKSQETTAATPSLDFERTNDYVSTYANSVIFEASAWDIKLNFGQLDQRDGKTTIKQHISVTIPWPQAKLALFWLRVQVEAAEMAVNQKIPIRKDLLPAELPSLTPEQEKESGAKEFQEWYRKAREEFLRTV